MPATAPSKTARSSFDGRKLERLDSLYRQEEGDHRSHSGGTCFAKGPH